MTAGGKARLLRSAPYFPVEDVRRSASYYEHVLGFQCEDFAGDPPEFAICSRDGLSIMLRRVADPARIVPSERQGGTWDAFFWIDNARALHAELVAKNATVIYGPVRQVYGVLEFAIRDADGHVLGFGEEVEPPKEPVPAP